MTDKEMGEKLFALEAKHARAVTELLEAARAILPLLRDQKLEHVAHEFGAKVFAVDLAMGDVIEVVKANQKQAIGLMLRSLMGEKP